MKRAWLAVGVALLFACKDSSAPDAVHPGPAHPTPALQPSAPPAPPGSSLATAPDFLSPDWARRQAALGAGDEAQAEALRKQAYALYKQKRDAEAVQLYERALALHPSGQLYYDYANSLSNVQRLPDSVKGYALAVELGYVHPELALYNTACAQSRLQDAKAAYASLTQAVDKGYVAFAKMEKDPDLEFLRKTPEWQSRLAELSSQPEVLVGTLVEYDDRVNNVYVVCPNGTVESAHAGGLDESCCRSRALGQLSSKGGKYIVRWQKLCGRTGLGGRKSTDDMEICQPYKRCTKDEVCKPLTGKEQELLGAETARNVLGKPPRKDPELGDWEHSRFEGQPPAVCHEQL